MSNHYDEKYFEWQKTVGVIGGVLNKFKFEEYIDDDDKILDFGCGGGYLLSNFKNSVKHGFEINKHAHEECKLNGVVPFDDYNTLTDCYYDIIISNHAFEHVPDPLIVFQKLFTKLKQGGIIVIVIPYEQGHESSAIYKENDINQHLYTWCPQAFGNLAKFANYKIINCSFLRHQWIPDYQRRYLDNNIHELCEQHALKNNNYQVRLVAKKE